MSIIQQHTSATLSDAWRTINIDAYNEDSSVNFDTSTLHPPQPEISETEVRQLAGQVRQLLRGGDAEGALRGCLETPVYNGTDGAKVGGGGPLLRHLPPAMASSTDALTEWPFVGRTSPDNY
jgi:actin related protein 2/3 complex subunit 5